MDHLSVHERLDLVQAARKDLEHVPCPRCSPRIGRPTPMKVTERTKSVIHDHCTHCGREVRLTLSHL